MTRQHSTTPPLTPGRTDEWGTPQWLLARMGRFRLDPCAMPSLPWTTARVQYGLPMNGLALPWTGPVWLNPPYSSPEPWMHRLAELNDGVALVFARTDTGWWHRTVTGRASALLFLRGRLSFVRPNGLPGPGAANAPSVLISYGPGCRRRLQNAADLGQFVPLP